jgi:8-oxo-dGTP diphosphatase
MAQVNLVLVSAGILVDESGRVLMAQRPAGKNGGGLWEFPGGKIEPGESPEAALIRELREELAISVREDCLAPFAFASHSYATFHLLMPTYVCRKWEGTPTALEHAALRWLMPEALNTLPLMPADLPLAEDLRVRLSVFPATKAAPPPSNTP